MNCGIGLSSADTAVWYLHSSIAILVDQSTVPTCACFTLSYDCSFDPVGQPMGILQLIVSSKDESKRRLQGIVMLNKASLNRLVHRMVDLDPEDPPVPVLLVDLPTCTRRVDTTLRACSVDLIVAFLKRGVRRCWPRVSNECIVLELRDQMLPL